MRKCHGSIFLVIVQAWIVPCHGFAYTPHSVGTSALASSPTGRHASFAAPLPCPPTAGDRAALSSLSMSDQGGGGFDAFEDEDQRSQFGAKSGDDIEAGAPEPFREEHSSGGSRFSELLARAKGEVKPPAPVTPRREAPPQGGPNYDNDEEWAERVIGSPDLPQPPLRNEMPGMQLSPELDQVGPEGRDGGGGGGGESRFQRMMSQAQANEQRQVAGVAPRTSPRSQEGEPPPPPMSQGEKDRALRAAVDRQQKLMAKARGIDLDDPSLDGPGLAKKRALSRLEAESSAGGYIPSSSAADDYMAQLKSDSRKKVNEQDARLSGREIPAMSDEFDDDFVAEALPQKRTSSTFSITNKADAYMASLKGIKIDLPESSQPAQPSTARIMPPQVLQPPPKPPLGPSMSYAEKLKLAKKGSVAPQAAAAAPQAAAAAPAVPVAPAAPVAPATPAASLESETPPAPTLSYSERLKQAQEAKGGVVAAPAQAVPAPAARPPTPEVQAARPSAPVRLLEQEVPESALLGEDATLAKLTRVVGMLTEQEAAGVVGEGRAGELRDALVDVREILRAEAETSAPQHGEPTTDALGGDSAHSKMARVVSMLAEQEAGVVGEGRAGELRDALVDVREMLRAETEAAAPQHGEPATATLGEDVARAKMTRVMDLLTEHKKSGLIGEERVTELRSALLDAREFLRAETFGEPAPSAAAPAVVQKPSAPAAQPQQPAPASADDVDILRRCNALLAAHIHAPLTGQDAEALVEGLASSLAIVGAQVGGVTVTVGDPTGQEAPRADAVVEAVPAYAGGIQSVGSALADMGVGDKPETFEPESDSGASKGWLGGSLGDYEKGVASKALGYLLKHRGGKGYGRGRVKGREAEMMVSTLAEVAEIMEEEMTEN